MSGDTLILVAALDAERGARARAGQPIEVRARAAMEAVRHFWGSTDEQVRFKGALLGLLRCCDEDEKERVQDEIRQMARVAASIAALQSGVPVDWDSLSEEGEAIAGKPDRIGLQKIWREVYGS